MLKRNKMTKVLSFTSILFILFFVFNFTIIYAEKLPDVKDVIKEIPQDKKNEIIEVKQLNKDKYVIVGNRESENGTAESWIKIVDEGEFTIEKKFLPDVNVKRKILSCVTLDEDGNYVLGGYKQEQGEVEYKAWLLLLDKDREEVFYNTYGDKDKYSKSEFKALIAQKDEGYIAVGWKCDKGKFDDKNYDTWVVSLNSKFEQITEKSFDKIGVNVKDFATDIVRVTPANSQEVNYIIAIEEQKENNNSIWLIKINESLEKIGKEKEINLSGKGGIYYISEDNEDCFILVGYDYDANNSKFLWVKKFLDIDKKYKEWEYKVGGDNRFVYGVEKGNENYFTLISYHDNIEIPLQLAEEGINEKDYITEEEANKGQSDGEDITTAEEEDKGEETEEGEEITIESRETNLLNKIKEYINNTKKLFLFLLIGSILFLVVIYFAIKSQKKGKLNKIEYKNFSLGRIEEIESLLKRIQIELKKELYEAEQLNNFSYKQRLKEIKIKFMSVAKKYKSKDVDLLVIQNQLDALLKEIKAFIR